MSYIVEQEINGNIYLYSVEAKWDKEKKQSRQKRTYIGPKDRKNKLPVRKLKGNQLISVSFGNIFFLRYLSKEIGLYEALKSCFPEQLEQILALVFYEIIEAAPQYLFEYWQHEVYLPGIKTMDSQECSSLCEKLGKQEVPRLDFLKNWITHNQPISAAYYDITSISSYSTNISFIEWGYNRDKENLPQLNMGVLCNQKNGTPLYYNIFPGSIVDVSTLHNNLNYLNALGLSKILLIMDRGFFSTSNVVEMNHPDKKIQFIQPLPLSIKKVRELISQSKQTISSTENAFKYNEEILYSIPLQISLGNNNFEGHLYFNEKAELDQKQHFLKALLEIYDSIKELEFPKKEDAVKHIESSVTVKYQSYFQYNSISGKIEKNINAIEHFFSNLGCYLMITNSEVKIGKEQMLTYYRNKDKVEKIFDLVKNEMDGDRLRAHNEFTNQGRLFVRFIALILSSHINFIMSEKKLFKMYSMKELLAELKKIKFTKLHTTTPFISEISKKQRIIFEAFNIPTKDLHSY